MGHEYLDGFNLVCNSLSAKCGLCYLLRAMHTGIHLGMSSNCPTLGLLQYFK